MPNEKIAANKVNVNLPALERSPGRQAPFAYWDNEPAISDALHGVHVRQFHPLNEEGRRAMQTASRRWLRRARPQSWATGYGTHVSYNGRVWAGASYIRDAKPLYDNRA